MVESVCGFVQLQIKKNSNPVAEIKDICSAFFIGLSMSNITDFKAKIFSISQETFQDAALELFFYHANTNPVYKKYVNLLNIEIDKVDSVFKIPFLPIELFKNHIIVPDKLNYNLIFESSGTTGVQPSRHHITDIKLYEQSIIAGFRHFYGNPEDFVFFALLPSYLERTHSSLVYMANFLMRESRTEAGGFYLYNYAELAENLEIEKNGKRKIFLIGVSFALLDFADAYNINLSEAVIMETGGMKGRREELIREELHEVLNTAFNAPSIHSEYSMTELLSQAYSKNGGVFKCPPWMKILIREPNDPFTYCQSGQAGGINIIDMANMFSCPFIATQDLGKLNDDGSFEVLGRFDNAEIRGCSLLY